MELSWYTRIRIAVAIAAGILCIGFGLWSLAAPEEPLTIVSLAANSLNFGSMLVLAVISFFLSFAVYFICWPQGSKLAVLTVASGLAAWAIKSASMGQMMQNTPDLNDRIALYSALKWEPILWLLIVIVGFLGVIMAHFISEKIRKNANISDVSFSRAAKEVLAFSKPDILKDITASDQQSKQAKAQSKAYIFLNPVVAIVVSVLLTQLLIGVFAQDVRMIDSRLGSVTGQPAKAQIAFAVMISFCIAGFIVKKFLDTGFLFVIIAAAFITAFSQAAYLKPGTLEYLTQQWPAVFFPHPGIAILPIQIVSFGTIGAILGYWLTIRYEIWRKHGDN